MPSYSVTWVDYKLPPNYEFSVAVCGRTGRIRHMFIGKDDIRRILINQVDVDGQECNVAEHCLDVECPLNRTSGEHLAHMLDMSQDEELDEDTAKVWGTTSTAEAFVEFARRMNENLPEELHHGDASEQMQDETPDD